MAVLLRNAHEFGQYTSMNQIILEERTLYNARILGVQSLSKQPCFVLAPL